MKLIKKTIITLILAALVLILPVQAFAVPAAMTNFGESISTEVFSRNKIFSVKSVLKDGISVITGQTNAKIYLDKPYMSYRVYEFNMLFNKWETAEFVNHYAYLDVIGLTPNTYHKIKLYGGDKFLGYYEFLTEPENVRDVVAEVTKKDVTLKWDNAGNYLTEVFKKPKNGKWKKIASVKSSEYVDTDIEQDSYYYYKIRYVNKDRKGKHYSPFKAFDEVYVPLDINNILEVGGYIIIRQNDPLNRTIPYPYKDNGKKLGSSGCGVCSSLMIIRNLTDYEPTLESYTEKLVEIGARASYGSDIYKISDYLKSEYKISHKYTKDIDKLKKHLEEGNMAIAHVGVNKLFAKSGHFVVVAGIVKDKDQNERAIILDPTFSKSKYSKEKRVAAGIEYSDDGIVTAPFETLLFDCKDEYFTLYTAD